MIKMKCPECEMELQGEYFTCLCGEWIYGGKPCEKSEWKFLSDRPTVYTKKEFIMYMTQRYKWALKDLKKNNSPINLILHMNRELHDEALGLDELITIDKYHEYFDFQVGEIGKIQIGNLMTITLIYREGMQKDFNIRVDKK